MAVQPSSGLQAILASLFSGQTPRSAGDPNAALIAKSTRANTQDRFLPEPTSGYDSRAPRGTYLDILA